jgi:hypothetical protein
VITVNDYSSPIQAKVARIYIASGLIFLAELGGDPNAKVTAMELEFEYFTLGVLQVAAFFVILQAMLSLLIHRTYSQVIELHAALSDLGKVPDPASKGDVEAAEYARNILSQFEKRKELWWAVFVSVHLWVPVFIGIVAMFWAFPDVLHEAPKLWGGKLSICSE